MRAVESFLASSLKLILFALPVLVLLSTTLCHAESCEPGGSFPVETVTSITPSTMYAGQTYNVVIMGSFPYDIPTYPGCNLNIDYVDQDLNGDEYQDVSILKEPDSISYSQGTFSATEITLTITIGPDAPPGTAYLSLGSDGGAGTYVAFQIACPTPTITSISPNVWLAGQSYPITITGTGFITQASSDNSGCPVSTVSVSTNDSFLLNVPDPDDTNVVSATQITATVSPNGRPHLPSRSAAFYGAAAATVAVTNVPPPASPGTSAPPVGSATAPADVVGTTAIQWTSDPNGSSPIISGTTQQAVVGQQIVLTGLPTEANISGLPISLTISPSTWTIGGDEGTNIGDYNTPEAPGSVTPTTLTGPLLTTYWVYPGTYPVTYEGCIDSQTATPALYDCTTATATFTVTGPNGPNATGTMTFTPLSTSVSIANLTTCVDDNGATWPGGPWMAYATGETGPACPGEANYPVVGISFNTPTGYTNVSDGNFLLVQLINNDVTTGESVGTPVAGLDGDYPYGFPPTSDSPKIHLQPTATSVTRTFSANMFLMWQWQSSTTNSIPVPLGYQTWGFSGTATCSSSCGAAESWTATNTAGTTPGPVGGFVPSSPTQTLKVGNNTLVDGYPTWTGPSQ